MNIMLLQVVPTDYIDKAGIRTNTNQFSVTENFRESAEPAAGGRSLPGVFFFYDLSPIKVRLGRLHVAWCVCAASVVAELLCRSACGRVTMWTNIIDSRCYVRRSVHRNLCAAAPCWPHV